MDNHDLFDDYDIIPDQPDFSATLQALREYETGGTGLTVMYGLSGLLDEQVAELKPVWEQLKAESRRKIMRAIAAASETDFMMDYRTIGLFGLDDPDPAVREAAIDTLWIDDTPEFMRKLIHLVEHDGATEVRATAVSALGRFISMGELEELPPGVTIPAQELAIRLWKNSDETIAVRRRALEAISQCSHEIVPAAIVEAYNSPHHPLRVSAIFAMGCSCDDDRWGDIVMREIENADQEIQYEAARAAGALGLIEAVPILGQFAEGDDREIQLVAVWSLGEIGGREAMRILSALYEAAEQADDDDLLDALDEALGNATLMNDLGI